MPKLVKNRWSSASYILPTIWDPHAGYAIKSRDQREDPISWGECSSAGAAARTFGIDRDELRVDEKALEAEVSKHIGRMPFLWVEIDDPPRPNSLRAFIEKNSIALLSNYHKVSLDPFTN